MGADGYFALINQTEHVGAHYGLHPYRVRHLLDRYGSLIGEVLKMAEGRPDLLEPITEAPVYLKVEAWYAAAAEGAKYAEPVFNSATTSAPPLRVRVTSSSILAASSSSVSGA